MSYIKSLFVHNEQLPTTDTSDTSVVISTREHLFAGRTEDQSVLVLSHITPLYLTERR
jgi:hypothetical protein